MMPRYSEPLRPRMFVDTTHPQITRLYHGDRFKKKPRGMDDPQPSGSDGWEVINITPGPDRQKPEQRVVSVGSEVHAEIHKGWASHRKREQVISQFQAFLQKCALGEMIRTQQWIRQLKTYEMSYCREEKKRLLDQSAVADDTAEWLKSQGWKDRLGYVHDSWPHVKITRMRDDSYWRIAVRTEHGRVETNSYPRLAHAVDALSSLLRVEQQLSHLKDIP